MTVIKINLLPQDVRKKRVAEKGLMITLAIIALVIGLCVLVSFGLYFKANTEAKNLEVKKAQVAEVEKEISKYGMYKDRQEQVKAHRTALDETINNEVLWHRFANEMSMIVPDDITLTTMKLDETGAISLEGISYDYSLVAEYLVRLNDLDLIQNVWMQKIETGEMESITVIGESSNDTSDTESKVFGVTFSIVASLKEPIAAGGTTSTSGGSSSSGGTTGTSDSGGTS